jgi:LPS-assembly lipoprotein
MKNVFSLISLTLIMVITASCGFKPLYAKRSADSALCDNFRVKEVNLQDIGQRLRYNLQDSLNNSCLGDDKKYQISISLERSLQALAIQKDREVTRYNAILVGDFSLIDEKGEVIFAGSSKMIGGFDAVVSDYGTYAQEQDALDKLAEEMARDISLRIAAKLAK